MILRKELEPEENNLIIYINKFQEYEQFFNENLNKNKFASETIQKILNNSEFILMNNNIAFFFGSFKDNNNKQIFIDYDNIIDLRDRTLTNRYKKIEYNAVRRSRIL